MHSRHHLELKSEYPLPDDVSQTVYETDFYFFFPSQLHVTDKSIGVERFLNNTQIYTRFSSPALSLDRLVDPLCEQSPLKRIRTFISLSEWEHSKNKDTLLYELQTLVNMYRSEITGFVRLMRVELKKQSWEDICSRRIEQVLDDMTFFLKDFRELHSLFLNPHVSDKQRKALAWADESISIITERNLIRLFSYCDVMESSDHLKRSFGKITALETEYRKSMNYQYLYLEEDSRSGERLAYRESLLKKWSQSAMYMNSEESNTPRRIGHILAGAAAGVAMIFAVFATIFAGKFFPMNSTPWVLLVVLAYIFKDRIKEILREIFGSFLPRLTPDQLTILTDPAVGKKVGLSRGSVRFGSAGKVPDNIHQVRYRQPNPFRSILPEQTVIHYSRTIRLNSRKLKASHSRLRSVTDIVRLRIDDWLREMDDPNDVFYRLEKDKKIKIKGNRVYKVHLVVSLKERRRKGFRKLFHYLIVINKAGILRIETLEAEVY